MGYRTLRMELFEILSRNIPPEHTYHNIHHARDVLDAMNTLIRWQKVSGNIAELLRLAAIGHDIGFVKTIKGHEKEGAEMIRKLMLKHHYSQEDVDFVCKLILVTDRQNKPTTIYEAMILDADLNYLGSSTFYEKLKLLFEEWVSTDIIRDDYTAFLQGTWNFMESHEYYTEFAIKNRLPMKRKWMDEIALKIKTA